MRVSVHFYPSLYTTPSGALALKAAMSAGPEGAAAATMCSREERCSAFTEGWEATKETSGGARWRKVGWRIIAKERGNCKRCLKLYHA